MVDDSTPAVDVVDAAEDEPVGSPSTVIGSDVQPDPTRAMATSTLATTVRPYRGLTALYTMRRTLGSLRHSAPLLPLLRTCESDEYSAGTE